VGWTQHFQGRFAGGLSDALTSDRAASGFSPTRKRMQPRNFPQKHPVRLEKIRPALQDGAVDWKGSQVVEGAPRALRAN
jgi:hypothetical protein